MVPTSLRTHWGHLIKCKSDRQIFQRINISECERQLNPHFFFYRARIPPNFPGHKSYSCTSNTPIKFSLSRVYIAESQSGIKNAKRNPHRMYILLFKRDSSVGESIQLKTQVYPYTVWQISPSTVWSNKRPKEWKVRRRRKNEDVSSYSQKDEGVQSKEQKKERGRI